VVGIKLLADVRPHPGQELVSVDRAGEIVVDPKLEATQNLWAIVGIGDKR
jgi:hypothetical protein